eukprot:COSAG05_NODE_14206_length_404_cov_1.006557_1_plen_53_part_10
MINEPLAAVDRFTVPEVGAGFDDLNSVLDPFSAVGDTTISTSYNVACCRSRPS